MTIFIPLLSRDDNGGVHCWIRRCKFLVKNAMTTGVMKVAFIGLGISAPDCGWCKPLCLEVYSIYRVC